MHQGRDSDGEARNLKPREGRKETASLAPHRREPRDLRRSPSLQNGGRSPCLGDVGPQVPTGRRRRRILNRSSCLVRQHLSHDLPCILSWSSVEGLGRASWVGRGELPPPPEGPAGSSPQVGAQTGVPLPRRRHLRKRDSECRRRWGGGAGGAAKCRSDPLTWVPVATSPT